MSVRVRFAPSPTGVLHIGSVRTALFNWLFARHSGGKFLLRIEDTDKQRSSDENIKLIFEILKWLNIDWDEPPVIQSSRIARHKEIAERLVADGAAYYCHCSADELAIKKENAIKAGESYKYDGTCRHKSNKPTKGDNNVIRLKSELAGQMTVRDLVQGDVTIDNSHLDDFVLLRSDSSPTYMLSVVVDDHDMGITHIIRGDDHLTNTFKQIQIYNACGWGIPEFAHIPLIYGHDGAKLSKRHGAASAVDYRDLGYLPEAISNYLLRLGWSHGNDEIISTENAIKWFDIKNIGKSPSRFDMKKLQNLNAYYIRERTNESLLEYILPFIKQKINEDTKEKILAGMDGLKERAKTIVELAEASEIYIAKPSAYDEACAKYATSLHISLLKDVLDIIQVIDNPTEELLSQRIKELATDRSIKLIEIAQAIRAALCGKLVSPSVFQIMAILGIQKSSERIKAFISVANQDKY